MADGREDEGMMKGFGKRLFYYGIGFGLGCVLVWAMFYRNGDRPAWMPGGRVVEFLETVEVVVNDDLKCKLTCYGIPEDFMNKDFWDNATVDFKASNVKHEPCPEYKITSTTAQGFELEIYIESCETAETATLRSFSDLSRKDKNCDCE